MPKSSHRRTPDRSRKRIRTALRSLPVGAALALGAAPLLVRPAEAQTLRGSKPSVERMYWFAQSNRLSFHRSEESITAAAAAGRLVPLVVGPGLELANGVGWPYVTVETRQFVETLAPQYEQACGAPLVVTSAARPINRQPRNANPHSVHPTGIAVDLRRPAAGPCLDWLRSALLALESRGFIEATEERHPVHFHIAVLSPPGRPRSAPTLQLAVAGTGRRAQRVVTVAAGEVESSSPSTSSASARQPAWTLASMLGGAWRMEARPDRQIRVAPAAGNMAFSRLLPVASGFQEVATGTAASAPSALPSLAPTGVSPLAAAPVRVATSDTSERETHDDPEPAPAGRTYTVRQGDTLWDVSRRLHVKMDALARANGLGKRAMIKPGLVLKIPAASDHRG